jgi:hypothetical protein
MLAESETLSFTMTDLCARERGSSYRLLRRGDRIPRLLAGEGSLSLGGGDLSRRGERVYESYSRRGGDRGLSFLKSSLLGENPRRGGERGLDLQRSSSRLSSRLGLRERRRKTGERLRGREARLPPGVYVSAPLKPRRGGERVAR